MKKPLRIFLTLAASASSGFTDLMYRYIFYDTLSAMGHDVVFFPYHEAVGVSGNKGNLNRISETIYNRFISHHNEKAFDLFLSYYHGRQVVPELFRKVREKVFCVNYTTNFHQIDLYEPLLGEANLTVFVSSAAKGYFEKHGHQAYYMPFAGLRENLHWNEVKNGKISFIGTAYGPRANYLWRCLQQGLPVDIYGANWKKNHTARAALRTLRLESQIMTGKKLMTDTAYRCLNDLVMREIVANYPDAIHDPLSDKAYHRVLSESSFVLNFPESRHGHDYANPDVLIGANLRDFEVPTAGSLLMTQDNEEIHTMFNTGEEIVTFANEWEMVDKARFYLDHPAEVLQIAEAGHRRVIQEHLWEHRFAKFFTHLEQNFL